jgi:hypothetical protein
VSRIGCPLVACALLELLRKDPSFLTADWISATGPQALSNTQQSRIQARENFRSVG